MIGVLTAVIIVVLAALVLWGAPKLAAGRKFAAQSGELAEGLQRLTRSLGLGECDRRTVFGDVIHRLGGEFNRLRVDLEVQVGQNFGYTRVTIEFPQTLDQDLTILSDRKAALRNWVLRQKEVVVGVDDFDEDFILLARHEGRLKALLSPAIRFQLMRLFEKVDYLEVGDEALFVMARGMTDPKEVSRLVKKAVETTERLYATATQLGPSPSRMGASVYTQATNDIYSREDEAPVEGSASTSAGGSLTAEDPST